ncbi:MAG TPA: hypothetical protein ENI18_02775 [Candidatus Aminicenantes bacterium]|nr:hypothetical protein [Candidatus Aminicenantes bacterium]
MESAETQRIFCTSQGDNKKQTTKQAEEKLHACLAKKRIYLTVMKKRSSRQKREKLFGMKTLAFIEN